MAMSETMSGQGEDWVHFYHHHGLSGQPSAATLFGLDRVSDATVVTTTLTSSSAPSLYGGNSSSGGSGHLNPEGRVSKPIRRRSRASRRTPTTLLNTDTANFRAMVQQFTGGPCGPFSSGPHHPNPGAFTFNFGRQYGQGGNPALMFPYHQVQFQRQQQQQQQQQQQHEEEYMLSLNSNHGSNNSSNSGGDTFFQRLSNPPPRANVGGSSEGFVMEGVSQLSPRPHAPSNEVRSTNAFMF